MKRQKLLQAPGAQKDLGLAFSWDCVLVGEATANIYVLLLIDVE